MSTYEITKKYEIESDDQSTVGMRYGLDANARRDDWQLAARGHEPLEPRYASSSITGCVEMTISFLNRLRAGSGISRRRA